MNYITLFFAGVFLCNCIPHLVCGLKGESFPTPFAKPRGIGLSSPLLNFIWGVINAVAGGFLLARHLLAHHELPSTIGPDWLALFLGFIAIGVYLSIHFGKVRQASS